jgi:cell division protease FtsH
LNKKPNGMRDFAFYILVFIILVATVSVLFQSPEPEPIQYSEVLQLFKDEKVESFTIEADELRMNVRQDDGTTAEVTHNLYDFSVFYLDLGELIEKQRDEGIITEYNYDEGFVSPWWVSFIPYLVIAVIFGLLWYFMMRRGAGADGRTAMRFGKARTRHGNEERRKVTFEDVAGADEEKEELQEIVEFLKNPAKFTEIGARIPKGVLLVGPPGTGKTLIARAVAGETGVQFLSISGSDFVELYVGVGASRVRDLFDQAKKIAPCVVFIDEIDAVGRQRGAGLGGGHDEREQTLNQLLVEMDGFGNNEGVIVMAATNRADILDPALLRPGRFDRQVYVGLPDIRGREAILKVHARGKPIAEDVDFSVIARTTAGFTGADLENVLNEAALLAARRDKRFISMPEIEDAIIKVIAGPEKKSKKISEKERRLTAYHEAGHAVVIHELPTHDPVHSISIIPRGRAGGMTISLPSEDRNFVAKSEMQELIVSFLGGRVAEKLVLDDISTGASNDIQRATQLARDMVTKYGMSDELGNVSFDTSGSEVFIGRSFAQSRTYSEMVAAAIDREVKSIIDRAYERCTEILKSQMDKLHTVAQYLLEHETMDGEEFRKVFET